MANVLYAYDKKDVEKIIDLVINRLRRTEGQETSSNPESDKLTQKQAALFLGVSETTLIAWKKKNLIPYSQIGRPIFYSKQELMACSRSKRDLNEKER